MPRQKTRQPGEMQIAGRRVVLRAMSDDDIAAVQRWYVEAAAAVHGLSGRDAKSELVGRGPSLDSGRAGALPDETHGFSVQDLYRQLEAARADPNSGLLVVVRRRALTLPSPSEEEGLGEGEGTSIGLLEYRVGNPGASGGGWLTIGFIAMPARYRGFGFGSEAVRLLEAEAARRWRVRRFRAGVDARNGLSFYFWLRLGYRPAGRGEATLGRDVLPMVRLPSQRPGA